MRSRWTGLLLGLASVLVAAPAGAQPEPWTTPGRMPFGHFETGQPAHPWGMTLAAGGGVSDFIGDDLRGMTGVGGTWDVRFAYGTRQLVGFEAAYLGTAQSIDAIGMDEDAILLSNGLEGGVRVNAWTGDLTPYVFAAAAWRRYELVNADTNTSSVSDDDDVFELPVGVGVAFGYQGLVFDARAAYRFAAEEDLVPDPDGEGTSTLDSFTVAAHAGVEF